LKTKKIFISAGETSGDIHGSNLIRQLYKKNPSIEIYGLGRSRMVEAGLHCIHDMSSRSVMWLQTLRKVPELWDIFSDCKRFFDEEKPELVILIDYAGFNFYLARAAKKRGIPVMYYISPQLWAHGPWRVKKLKKLVDKMESGEQSLEDALKSFQRGVELTRTCQQALKQAEQRVEKLVQKDGRLATENLEIEE